MKIKWVVSTEDEDFCTWTAQVPGGFLVKTTDKENDYGRIATAVVFVPSKS